MTPSTVPLSPTAQRVLDELMKETGRPALDIVETALDAYRRKVFFERLAADYAALKADPEAWAEELAERKLSEATLPDGLDPDERWSEDGRCLTPEPPKGEKP
jgi:hypothetical protein